MRFKVTDVGAISQLKEAAGGYVVPVTVAYCFQECWVIEPHAPKLKRISITSILASSI